MSPGVRVILIASAAMLIIVAISFSGQVLPLYGIRSPDTASHSLVGTGTSRESSFILTVIPAEARARPGDPVDYTVIITPQGGFHEPISLELDIDAEPVFKGSYNAGVLKPPYLSSYEYRVVVPPQAPAPLTVRGTLTAEGGDQRNMVELVLYITQ
ncbi:MAG: hypothetical protein GKC06_07990 [Methanomicrobiales archaeon]|nr:hypothetical protein [Methanomicrobiales archaeon]